MSIDDRIVWVRQDGTIMWLTGHHDYTSWTPTPDTGEFHLTTETHDPQTDATIVKELTRMAEENLPLGMHEANGRLFIVRRNDFTIEEKTLPNAAEVLMPKVATASVAIDTAASLIDYVNRFKNPNTVLFASEQDNKIVAVIDYHEMPIGNGPQDVNTGVAGTDADTYKVNARLGSQIATLTLRYADQWETWTKMDEKLVRHVDFATFLEENQFDVSRPAGAELLEICRDLQVKANMNFESSIRMGDQVSVSYMKDDDVSTKASIALPVNFETTIPVFFGEPSVKVLNWTRRKTDGGLWLGFKMSQRDLVEAREFARIVGEITTGVGGLTTIYGRRQA